MNEETVEYRQVPEGASPEQTIAKFFLSAWSQLPELRGLRTIQAPPFQTRENVVAFPMAIRVGGLSCDILVGSWGGSGSDPRRRLQRFSRNWRLYREQLPLETGGERLIEIYPEDDCPVALGIMIIEMVERGLPWDRLDLVSPIEGGVEWVGSWTRSALAEMPLVPPFVHKEDDGRGLIFEL